MIGSPEKKWLVVHLGLPRTGCIALREFCKRNQARLQTLGWSIENSDIGEHDSPVRDVQQIAASLHKAQKSGDRSKSRTSLESMETHLASAPGHVLVWGAWPAATEGPVWEKLKELCESSGRRLLILAYLREQRSWLLSAYAQRVMHRQMEATAARFVHKSRTASTLDYLSIYRMLERSVGSDQINFRAYAPPAFPGKDICRDFLAALNLPDENWAFSDRRFNASPGIVELELLRTLNTLPDAPMLDRSLVEDSVARIGLNDDHDLHRLVPQSVMASVREMYLQANEALSEAVHPGKRISLFQSSPPDHYPEFKPEERVNERSIQLMFHLQQALHTAAIARDQTAANVPEYMPAPLAETKPREISSPAVSDSDLQSELKMASPPDFRLGEETALIFVMNRKYIRPLKVLLYSLSEQRSLLKCPIEIVTDDLEVANDPFILKVARNIEYLSPESLTGFSTIRGEKIQDKSRTHFAPKYTFLKFVTFRERGYQRHVFIDADMLCLNPIDEALLAAPYDVKAMIEVGSSQFPIRDESRVRFDRAKALGIVSDASAPRERLPGTSINSGFMVFESNAISNAVFDLAIEVASTDAYAAEQPATTEVIRRIPNCRFLEMPIWYNARRRVLECLGEDFFKENEQKIVLLHYTPGKPWILGDRTPDYLDELWLAWEQRSLPWVEQVIRTGRR